MRHAASHCPWVAPARQWAASIRSLGLGSFCRCVNAKHLQLSPKHNLLMRGLHLQKVQSQGKRM